MMWGQTARIQSAAVVLLGSMCPSAQAVVAGRVTPTGRPTPDSIASAFLGRLEAGDDEGALRAIAGEIATKQPEQFANAVAQVASAYNIYGRPTAHELVSETIISPSLVKRTYISKTPRVPIFWNMYFYDGSNGWQVIQFDFADLKKHTQKSEP